MPTLSSDLPESPLRPAPWRMQGNSPDFIAQNGRLQYLNPPVDGSPVSIRQLNSAELPMEPVRCAPSFEEQSEASR
jgi:hypothetical protein